MKCSVWNVTGTPVPLKTEINKSPNVVPVGCIRLCKHNGVPSEFGKIGEMGKMCYVNSIDE